MNAGERTLSIDELSELTGTSRRTIRYYVQEGILARPEGVARGAHYTRRHLQRVLDILSWQAEGLTIDGIRQRLTVPEATPAPRPRSAMEVWTRITLSDGVELHLNAEVAGLTPKATRRLADALRDMLKQIANEGDEE